MSRSLALPLFSLALLLLPLSAWGQAKQENYFASIFADGKKVGQVHYTVSYNEKGEVENLKTRASVSILGVKVYDFSQDLNEDWESENLKTLSGRTNDDGKLYEVTLRRDSENYEAILNGKSVTLPENSFPIALWHYEITEHDLLFNLTDLAVLKVRTTKAADTLDLGGKKVAAERFDFTGGWQGKVWFDKKELFLKAQYKSNGREVIVTLDP